MSRSTRTAARAVQQYWAALGTPSGRPWRKLQRHLPRPPDQELATVHWLTTPTTYQPPDPPEQVSA